MCLRTSAIVFTESTNEFSTAFTPFVRTQGTQNARGCPFCAGRAVCPHNSLAVYDPAIAAEWSDKTPDKPENISAFSHARRVWRCGVCGKEWVTFIASRTEQHSGCPHCFDERCKAMRQKQPPVIENQHAMKYWDWESNQDAGLHPDKIPSRSHKPAHWICHACPKGQAHRWTTTVASVCRGTGCPCCRALTACVCNSLQSLHPDIAAEWDHHKNPGSPDDHPAQSNKKMWWHSSRRGSFQASI